MEPRTTSRQVWLARVLAAVLGLTVLAAAGGLALWWRPGLAAGLVMSMVQQRLSLALARETRVRAAALEWDAGLWVRLDGLEMESSVAGAAPTVTVERVAARVALQPLVSTLGRWWELRDVRIQQVRVTLEQDAAGAWRDAPWWTRVRERWDAQRALPPEHRLEVHVDGLTVDGLQLAVQRGSTHPLTLGVPRLTVDHVAPGTPMHLDVEGFVRGGGDTKANWWLSVDAGPLPVTLADERFPTWDARLKLSPLRVAPLWTVLNAQAELVPVAGTVALEANLHGLEGLRGGKLDVAFTTTGLVLQREGTAGAPLDLTATLKATLTREGALLDVEQLRVDGPALRVAASWRARHQPAVEVENLQVDAHVDAGLALNVLPAGVLPPEFSAQGPLRATARVVANAGTLAVHLDDVVLDVPQWLHKPRGTPLQLLATTRRAGELVEVSSFRVQLLTATLAGTAVLDPRSRTLRALDLDSGSLPVAEVARLAPPLQKALRTGNARGALHVQLSARDGAVTGRLLGSGLRVAMEHTRLGGQALVEVDSAAPEASGPAPRSWVLRAVATDLAVQHRAANGETLLDKPAGTRAELECSARIEGDTLWLANGRVGLAGGGAAFHARVDWAALRPRLVDVEVQGAQVAQEDVRWLVPNAVLLPPQTRWNGGAHVEWRRNKGHQHFRLEVPVFEVRTPHSMVAGSASARGWPRPQLEVDLRQLDVDGQDVEAVLVAAGRMPPVPVGGLRLQGRAVVGGTWEQPATVDVRLLDAVVTLWEQELHVDGHLRGLTRPTVEGQVRAAALDWDVLASHLDTGKRATLPGTLPDHMTLSVGVDLGKVSTAGVDIHKVQGRLTMAHGVVTLAPMQLGVLDGRVNLDATTLRVDRGELQAHVRATVVDLDVGPLVNQRKRAMDGRISAELDVVAHGDTPQRLLETATGPVAFHFKELTFHDLDLLGSVQLPGGARNPLAARERVLPPTILYDGNGTGVMESQRVQFTRTLATPTSFGFLEVDGFVDVHGYANLKGTAEVTPQAVDSMTGGAYRPRTPARTPIRLVGPPGELSILDVNARMFMKDTELPSLWESAGRVAQSTRENWRRRADEEAARIRERMEEERQVIQRDVQRGVAELRTLLSEVLPGTPDAGPVSTEQAAPP